MLKTLLNQCLLMSSVNTWKIIMFRQETSCWRKHLWNSNHSSISYGKGKCAFSSRGRHRDGDPLWGSGGLQVRDLPQHTSQACIYFHVFLLFFYPMARGRMSLAFTYIFLYCFFQGSCTFWLHAFCSSGARGAASCFRGRARVSSFTALGWGIGGGGGFTS